MSLADFSPLGPNQMLSKDIIITCDGQKKIRAFYYFAFFAFVLSDDTRSVAVAGPLLPLLALSQGPWPESCGGLFVIQTLS